MATNNRTILAEAFLANSNDYAQRLPDVTTAGIDQISRALFDPMNRDIMNYFSSYLINRIGGVRLQRKRFNNPLAALKGDDMSYGSTYMEVAYKFLKAHAVGLDDVKTETILKTHFPEGAIAFHSVNRRDVYETSVNDDVLRTSFTSETGLADYAAGLVDQLHNSDGYDTYQIYKQLFAEFHKNHGMFMHKVNPVEDKMTSDQLLIDLRAYADLLKFPSTIYNAQDVTDIPVWVDSQDAVLFTTPYTNASIDVLSLSAAFNIDRANFKYRVIILDEMPIPDCDAILTTPDFFVIKDTVYQMTDFYNAHSLTRNLYLHHHSINSTSPFVPCIGFSTSETIEIPVITVNVTGMTVTPPEQVVLNDVEGGKFEVTMQGSTDPEQPCGRIAPRPDSATFEILSVEGADGDLYFAPNDVFIDQYGILRVFSIVNPAIREAVDAGALKVNILAKSTYTNPSGATETFEELIEFANVVLCPEDAEGGEGE